MAVNANSITRFPSHDVANDIGAGLARAALAGKVNGELVDTRHIIDDKMLILRLSLIADEEGLDIIRHSTSHLDGASCQAAISRSTGDDWSCD